MYTILLVGYSDPQIAIGYNTVAVLADVLAHQFRNHNRIQYQNIRFTSNNEYQSAQ